MEFPISDVNLAEKMAYAEKPYRDMAKVAFDHDNTEVIETGRQLGIEAIKASMRIYSVGKYRLEKVEQESLEDVQTKNVIAYVQNNNPENYIDDLRKFSLENSDRIGGGSPAILEEAVELSKKLVLERGEEFRYIERLADSRHEFRHFMSTNDLSEKMVWLEDRENWKHIENQDGHLLLSFTRHILGYRIAANRLSMRQDAKVPAFDQLPEEYEHEAYEAITNEWFDYIHLVRKFSSITIISGKNRPLLYNSVDILVKALNEDRHLYSTMSNNEIISTFEKYSGFHQQCQWIMDQKEQKRLRKCESNPESMNIRNRTLKQEIFDQKFDNQEYLYFVASGDQESILTINDLGDIEKILKSIAGLHAAQMNDEFGEQEGQNARFAGFNLDFENDVRPKGFNGRIENVRMQYLPLTKEFKDTYIKKKRLEYTKDFAILARVGVFADLHSTGRGKIGESMQEYIIQAKNIQNPYSRTVRISKQANLNGKKLVEYLKEQSVGTAYIVERNDKLNPLSGGAPGLGKRK